MTTPPQEECLIRPLICTNIKLQRSEAFGVRLVGFLDEIAQSRCRSVELSRAVVASICLEIGEVVEEQARFDLDVVSNQSDSNQRT